MKKVSVIMSVYNVEERYLRIAIESILCQTLSDIEFIIIDDKSTDGSSKIIDYYKSIDDRIIVIKNDVNLGLTKSLNKGLKTATGKYIARMDADDYSVKDRLECQYNYLEKHNDVGVVGGYGYTGIKGARPLTCCFEDHDVNLINMYFRNAGVPHPTAMFRRIMPDGFIPEYDEDIRTGQDYSLWSSLIHHTKIAVIKKILIHYRVHDSQISHNPTSQYKNSQLVIQKNCEANLGLDVSESKLIGTVFFCKDYLSDEDIIKATSILLEKNNDLHFCGNSKFKRVINEIRIERRRMNKLFYNGVHEKFPKDISIIDYIFYLRFYYGSRLRYDFVSAIYYVMHKKEIQTFI